jgi:DNA-binding MarR family transcriptional regulator
MALPRNFRLDADQRARLGTQLLRLSHRYERALQDRLARWRLAATHYETLKLLYSAPDYSLTHSELAARLGVTLPSITLAVKKLMALRLLGQQRGEDRRRRVVTLTVKGAELLAPLYDELERFAEEVFQAIPEQGAAKVEAAIARLLSRLSELEDARAAA